MAQEPGETHRAWQERTATQHEEHLSGYRALLAEIEATAGEAQMEANDSGTPGSASQFTDDLRFAIAALQTVVNRLRGIADRPGDGK